MLEEQVKIAEEEEDRKYSDQTVADLTKLCIKVEPLRARLDWLKHWSNLLLRQFLTSESVWQI